MATLVDYMFRLIRDNLRSRNEWSLEIGNALKYQMVAELGVTIHPSIVGERHACETEWHGLNPRQCKDVTCSTEYRPVFNDFGTKRGFRQICEFMESSYWLLRAARITHPTVSRVTKRTRGEGFPGVLEEDKRLFCRGKGWEIAGSGDIEIEGFRF